MRSGFKRTDRVARLIQRKLAELIQQEVKDPRLPVFITISAVKVSTDLAYAKVYFTALDNDIKQTTSVLNAAASYLRQALAHSLSLRAIPELHFVYDESIEYGRKLSQLIDKHNPPDEQSN